MSLPLVVFALAQVSAPVSDNQDTISPLVQYHSCITNAAVRFEKAGEDASDTVEAAIATCRNIRNSAIEYGQKSRPPNSIFSAKVNGEMLVDLWDTALDIERGKAMAAVLEIRLKRRSGK